MSKVAIRINDVVKEYEVYSRPFDLAIEVLTRRVRHTKFRALDGISFEVQRGEVLGIIGPNGAGKSTLLKIITGVLDASSGSVDVAGRVTAILELGLGFNPEFSGRQNIYLSGLLYGMGRVEVDRKIDSIIAFSGLGDFIERPVKTYSSGMHSRLAFSIATAVDPEILIIDEALAAGDSGFVQKCLRRIRQLCSGGRTVLLVSHGTGLLAQLCSRVVWIERGRVRMIGPAIQVVQAYDLAAHQSADAASWIETVDDKLDTESADSGPGSGALGPVDLKSLFAAGHDTGRQIFRRGPVFIDSAEMINAAGERTSRLKLYERAILKINYRVEGPLPTASLGVAISINNRIDLSAVAQFYTQNIRPFESRETYDDAPDRRLPARTGALYVNFDYVPFRKGEYLLSIGLLPNVPATWEFYEYRHFYYPFSVDDAGLDVGAPIFLDLKMIHRHADEEREDAAAAAPPAIPGAPAVLAPAEPGVAPTTLRAEIERICRVEGGYPDAWPRHKACPACGKGPLAPAFSKYGFTHNRCVACGFVCVDPYPPEPVMGKLYDGEYYTQVRNLFELPRLLESGKATPFSAPEDTLRRIVKRAAKERPLGSWLDVGGGVGAFAALIADVLPDWSVNLNEHNERSISIARSVFRSKFAVVAGDLAELLKSGTRYDVISSVAVVEHIPDPLEFLQGYAALLKPGGMLVTVVPQFTALNAAIARGASPNVVPPFHVSLFNEASLRRLLARVDGLETLAVEQSGPAAFRLIDHVDTGDHWDISIPTPVEPVPRSIQIHPYADDASAAINALSVAQPLTEEFFARNDGRLLLVAFCKKKA